MNARSAKPTEIEPSDCKLTHPIVLSEPADVAANLPPLWWVGCMRLFGGTWVSLSRVSAWDLATARAVEYTPQGEILGKVLVMMLDPRSHEQEVA